jgi:phosphoribosyl 1,2-cyclic phosphodiesterase
MKIKFWGVRGSIPSPEITKEYREKLHKILKLAIDKRLANYDEIDDFINDLPFPLRSVYGGNTTCIEINDDNENVFILDAGTGIRILGSDIIKRNPKPTNLHLFFTHFHWDHMQGFPFFIPAYLHDFKINFYSTKDNFQNILYKQQNVHNFPKKISEMDCIKYFKQLIPGKPLKIDNTIIDCFNLYHPGGGTAYSFIENNKKVIFTGDVEFIEDDIENINKYGNFFKDADLAIMDSQYTLEESFFKFDWGHTSYTMAINLAMNWNIKNLFLTHFDPTYSDEVINKIEIQAKQHVVDSGLKKINVNAAYEGLKIQV